MINVWLICYDKCRLIYQSRGSLEIYSGDGIFKERSAFLGLVKRSDDTCF